jgi:hypothetical protein
VVDAEPVLDAGSDWRVKEADSEAELFADVDPENPLAEAERVRDSAAALETAPISMSHYSSNFR